MLEPAPFFALENISKRYGGVHALLQPVAQAFP